MQTARMNSHRTTTKSSKNQNYFPHNESIYLARNSLLLSPNQDHRFSPMSRNPEIQQTKPTRNRQSNKYRLSRSQSWNKPHVVLLSTSQDGDFLLFYDDRNTTNTYLNNSFSGDHRYMKNPFLNRIPTQITSLKRRIRKQRMTRETTPTLIFQPHPVRSSSIETNSLLYYPSSTTPRFRTHSLEKSTTCVPLPPVLHSTHRSKSGSFQNSMKNVCEC